MQSAVRQMMADPSMQQLMQQQMSSLLATPEGQAQVTAMLESNPMYQRWAASAAASRAVQGEAAPHARPLLWLRTGCMEPACRG